MNEITIYKKPTEIHTKKRMLMSFKKIYDRDGLPGVNKFLNMINESPRSDFPETEKKELSSLLTYMVSKFETCEEGCFEDLNDKWFFQCNCDDDPFELNFFDSQLEGEYEEN